MSDQKKIQIVDLYAPIAGNRPGAPPLVLRIGVQGAPQMMMNGPTASTFKVEPYVLVSAFPEDLRRRIEDAVQMLTQAI
jgi:hypothetical protein